MDRCEACPLFEGNLQVQESCGGGLPVSACIAKLQYGIFKFNIELQKRKNIVEEERHL